MYFHLPLHPKPKPVASFHLVSGRSLQHGVGGALVAAPLCLHLVLVRGGGGKPGEHHPEAAGASRDWAQQLHLTLSTGTEY